MEVTADFEGALGPCPPLSARSADDLDVAMSHADKATVGGAPSSDGASLTWDVVRANRRLALTFEDPISGSATPVAAFESIYGRVLTQLDGGDLASFVDFFFEASPIDITCWAFRDDDAREDFLDWAVELGCVPPMCDVQAGETGAELAARKAKEAHAQHQPPQAAPAPSTSTTPTTTSTTSISGDSPAAIIGGSGASLAPERADEATLRAYAEREREARAAALREQAAREKAAAERDAARKRASKAKAANKKEAQLVASLHKLNAALANPELANDKRAKLEGKRDRVISMLSHSSEGYTGASVTRSRSGGRGDAVACTGGGGGGAAEGPAAVASVDKAASETA